MYNINAALPLWNRYFTSFALALRTMETELHGEPSTVHDTQALWESVCKSGQVYLGECQKGAIYLTMIHTMNGTKYCATFGA